MAIGFIEIIDGGGGKQLFEMIHKILLDSKVPTPITVLPRCLIYIHFCEDSSAANLLISQ